MAQRQELRGSVPVIVSLGSCKADLVSLHHGSTDLCQIDPYKLTTAASFDMRLDMCLSCRPIALSTFSAGEVASVSGLIYANDSRSDAGDRQQGM
nr:hypothetical protein CFP56_13398 [Quercus suber]